MLVKTRTPQARPNHARTQPHKYHQWGRGARTGARSVEVRILDAPLFLVSGEKFTHTLIALLRMDAWYLVDRYNLLIFREF